MIPDIEIGIPGIPIDGRNVEILETPTEFYQKLLELTTSAQKRVSLSSLYLGEGDLEKKLVSTIRERLDRGKIDVTILLDHLRGTRRSKNGESSVTVLEPISEQANIFLYHTPELSGLLKKKLPQRADEIVGLQHMKLYIFDDTVLISGANLSDSYFTDRTDRYFLFKDCKQLADFFNEIIQVVGDSSFTVKNGQVVPSSKCDVHPYLGEARLYRELLKSRVEKVIQDFRETSLKSENENSNEKEKTWIYPILQMGLLGVDQELELLRKIFSSKDSELTMTMASGYFNFTEEYEDLIFQQGTYPMDILTASPFANGFFESAGFSKYIPPLYSNISRNFLRKQEINKRTTVKMHEYFRKGWTFHAKGLWTEKGDAVTTLVGSSNYGYRSVHRDLEAQVLVVTSEEELVQRMNLEKSRLFEYSTLLDAAALQKPEHHTPHLVRLVSRIVRSFL